MEELENEISTQVEENTVSLASAQALADALAKIEVYTPTTWVDNSSPDIDAEHLNKPEQAIKRVTDALNSAVDVIKDLQSQVTKNAGDISTVNNNLSKCLQYIHSETDVFDFNDPKTPAGYHRLGAAASYKNAPSGLDGVNFCTVEVVRPTISDTLAMTIYPYKKGINPPVWYKSGGSNEWSTLPWNVYAIKSDSGIVNYKDQITSDLINSYVETNFNQASVVTMTNGSKFAIINLTFNLKNSYTANAQIELMTFPKELRPQKNVVFFGYTNRKSSFVYYSVAKNKLMFIPSVNVTPNETELNIGGSYQIS